MRVSLFKVWSIIGLALYLAALFILRNEYLSPDSIYFLNADFSEVRELRYKWWVLFVGFLGRDFLLVFFAASVFYLGYRISKQMESNYLFLLVLALMPSVFYFSTVLLRDQLFLISSLYLIAFMSLSKIRYTHWLLMFFIMAVVVTMRPSYGAVYLVAFSMFVASSRRIDKFIIMSVLALYIGWLVGVLLLDGFNKHYFDFIMEGHGKRLNIFGVTETEDYSNWGIFKNALLSPAFFWIIPPSGTGVVLDSLMYFENFIISIVSILILVEFIKGGACFNDKLARVSLFILIASFFMAAVTQTHGDVMRFRLFFMPFFVFLGVRIIATRYGIRLTGKGGRMVVTYRRKVRLNPL